MKSSKFQSGFTIVELLGFIIFLVVVVGWIKNIVEIFATVPLELTGMLILRIAGVFIAPLGAVLGYL